MMHVTRFVSFLLPTLASATGTTLLYSSYSFNPLEHLAGITPYFEPQTPQFSPAPPSKCTPVRVGILSRHAAIYTNDFDYEEYIEPFVQKLANHSTIDWSRIPTLHFLAGWTPPFSDAEEEILTRVGKLEATELGVSLSFRYPTLRLPKRVWTASSERTTKSAEALIRGLRLQDGSINLVSVYEGKKTGANSLTPERGACTRYQGSAGAEESEKFREIFTRPIIERLNTFTGGKFGFTDEDVYGMMQLCGYESVVRGGSKFCDLELFSPDEWLAFEYAEDVRYHYNTGYGSQVAGVMGLPWVQATAGLLLNDDQQQQDIYVSFAHRAMPAHLAVAMGLFNNTEFTGGNVNDTMPLDRINHQRAWKSSHVLPFLSNIAIERLNCSGSYGFDDGDYYRVLFNNGPQQLPGCGDGPGTSCSREAFQGYLQQRIDLFGGFSEKCGVDYGNSTDVLSIYTDAGLGNGTVVAKRWN
ncbi:histidine phosphatase superfamily [Cladorrhinum sp. PSN259]|nr:histidine phosphatase superfamily [Cladorrhinum sp. PSN259]